jgi:hypothetical protein
MLPCDFHEVARQRCGRSRLKAKIDRGSTRSMYLAVDRPRYRHSCDASRRERNTKTSGDKAHESRPLRRMLNNVLAESISFAAGDRSVKR